MQKMNFIKRTEEALHYMLLLCVALVILLASGILIEPSLRFNQGQPSRLAALIVLGSMLVFMEHQYWLKFHRTEETPLSRFALGSLRLAQFIFLGLSPGFLTPLSGHFAK